jgi:hypothetical protein
VKDDDINTVNTTIHRKGDRIWLEGVKGWSLHEWPSSVHAAQAAVMSAVGEDISYDYLLGVSGLAFRMQVSKKTLCPSSPHSFCGYRCVARSREALPWQVRVFEMKPEQSEKVHEARQAVVGSIEHGVPVQYGNEEDGIIVGYQRKGDEWICLHPLRDRGQKPFIATQWPWGVAVFTQRKPQVLSRRELALGAREQAVTMGRTKDAEAYWVGFKAWDDYIARLKAIETADETTKSDALLGNAWIYECLASYRASAARYLREVAGEFEAPVAAYLTQAAALFEQISSKILCDEARPTIRIAPYPGGPNDGRFWTPEIRCEQVRRLETALPLEREAIGGIETALRKTTGLSNTRSTR